MINTNQQEILFNSWQILSHRIRNVGGIIQNTREEGFTDQELNEFIKEMNKCGQLMNIEFNKIVSFLKENQNVG